MNLLTLFHVAAGMCVAVFIAAASFFLGQQDEFPAALRGLAIWFAPPFLVLAVMIFWILRVRFASGFGRRLTVQS